MCLSAVLTVAFSYHAVAADLPEIEKSGTLKVATEDDYAPFNFMNNGFQGAGFFYFRKIGRDGVIRKSDR